MSGAPQSFSWWSPSAWRYGEPPGQFLTATQSGIEVEQAMRAAGYQDIVQIGNCSGRGDDGLTDHEIKVWSSEADRHLYVEIWDVLSLWAEFFVAPEDRAPFFADKLPTLISAISTYESFTEHRKIRRALVAFIRHGQSESTVDEDGESTLDDRRRRAALQAAAKAAKARKEATSP